jgi:hypothetical protein
VEAEQVEEERTQCQIADLVKERVTKAGIERMEQETELGIRNCDELAEQAKAL